MPKAPHIEEPGHGRRGKRYPIRLTDDERKAFAAKAEAEGKQLSHAVLDALRSWAGLPALDVPIGATRIPGAGRPKKRRK